MLDAVLTAVVAVFFALMGLLALVKPSRILAPFGIHPLPVDAANEVRAVYGGFGVAIALLLFATLEVETIRDGARLSVAMALLGMAAGRIVAAAVDRRLGPYPRVFLIVEVVLAGMLLAAMG
jgi:hypothetical protein